MCICVNVVSHFFVILLKICVLSSSAYMKSFDNNSIIKCCIYALIQWGDQQQRHCMCCFHIKISCARRVDAARRRRRRRRRRPWPLMSSLHYNNSIHLSRYLYRILFTYEYSSVLHLSNVRRNVIFIRSPNYRFNTISTNPTKFTWKKSWNFRWFLISNKIK